MTPDEPTPFNPPAILDAQGKPVRRQAVDTTCPSCGAGESKRVASCGFGIRRPCCSVCGFVWTAEVFVEKER